MIKPKRAFGPGHRHEGGPDHMPDPEKIKEILNVVSDRVPELLKKLSDVLYGTDQAKKFGRAAAVFYNELKDTGMSKAEIFELTREYMGTLNLGNLMSNVASRHKHDKDFDEEVGEHVRKRIKKELEE